MYTNNIKKTIRQAINSIYPDVKVRIYNRRYGIEVTAVHSGINEKTNSPFRLEANEQIRNESLDIPQVIQAHINHILESMRIWHQTEDEFWAELFSE